MVHSHTSSSLSPSLSLSLCQWPKGFVQATCSPDASLWRGDVMPGWNQDWTTGAVQPIQTILPGNTGASAGAEGEGGVGGGGGGNSVVCDEWVEHPVLVVQVRATRRHTPPHTIAATHS